MGLFISQIRDQLRKITGQDTDDITDGEIDLYINMAWWEIADKFKFPVQVTKATTPTAVGTFAYSLSLSIIQSIDSIAILDFALNRTRLEPISQDQYLENHTSDSSDFYAIPINYLRQSATIVLEPTPDDIYTLEIYYRATLTDLSDGNPQPNIPQAWHEIIKYGAAWRIFGDLGDHDKMILYQNTQAALSNSTTPVENTEKADNRYAGVFVHGYEGEL